MRAKVKLMNESLRKKSPRAPSVSLEQAIDGAIKVYEKERRHPAPVEAVAQHLGYKSANNGAALKAMASIRYYGLLERPSEGMLAVSKDVESYQYAPSPELRRELVRKWLKTPPVFSDLLDKYSDGLPSDANLRFEFIQRGFLPDSVDSAVSVFRNSVNFAQYYEALPTEKKSEPIATPMGEPDAGLPLLGELSERSRDVPSNTDRIPIRLPGSRRAWLEIPSPFYASDKERLKKQIDLLLTEEDEQE
jgi:hypothetical protein